MSFGYEHEVLTDKQGYIWYSDIGNNAVGYLDPETGAAETYRAPEVPRNFIRSRSTGVSGQTPSKMTECGRNGE